MDDFSNRVIKGYEFKECVGAGGFGAVYRAYQPAVGREVAIKVILSQHANQADFIRRFEVEAQLIARLEHPHIVPLYDYWREPDGAFLVMRWLRGSLRGSVGRGAWTAEAVARLLEQIAGALTVAHREDVIHRDIKPDNILLDEDDNAYLADFGIAKNLSVGVTEGNITQAGEIIGSPAYITPEQLNGDAVTVRTDIYSLGLVIYEMLVGEKPYADAQTPYELMVRQLNTPLPPLHTRQPNLPAALNEVLQTATAKDPARRYANALRFAAAFRAALPNLQRAPAQPLPEPLTGRELDIIRLMIEGLSNVDIAQRLVLSAMTVKWYIQQIYSKLDVHSRQQAVQRAKQLNLNAHTPIPGALNGDLPTLQTAVRKQLDTVEPVNPYKGLRAFQEADAADFFGRAALTERLLARLTESGDGSRFLVVIGPSGSGKSSVVRAGLIPALRRGDLPNSDQWFITDMLPGTHPLEELEAALLRVATGPQSGLLEQLSEDRRGLVRAAKRLLPTDQQTELILVIDQFEELFTLLDDEAVRTHFIDNLLSAVTDPRSRVRIVLTLRADFYDKPLMYPRLAELVRSHTEVILPLGPDELERAIAGPAERVGLSLEPGLAATMIKDVGEQPGTLPLLQYALAELYEHREERSLTLDAYRASGGLSGALAVRADDLFNHLDTVEQAAARQLFLRLITPGEGTEDVRRRVLLTELAAITGSERAIDDVISVFSQYRLLTFDHDPLTRGATVELAHEALIREWGRLREWLREGREDLRMQRRLMSVTAEWVNAGREASFLATGIRLDQFSAWAGETSLALTQDEQTYLEISLAEANARRATDQVRKARELTFQRRAANRLRYVVAILFIAVLGALSLTGVTLGAEQSALNNAATATNAQGQAQDNAATSAAYSNRLALADSQRIGQTASNLAQSGSGQNGELAALISLQALKLAPSYQAYEGLLDANTQLYTKRVYTFSNALTNVGFASDGKHILIGSYVGSAYLMDAQTGQQVGEFPGSGRTEFFSLDGQQVLTFQSNTIQLWDATTVQKVRTFTDTDGWEGVAFSSGGRYILGVNVQHVARLWDVSTGQQVSVFDVSDKVIEQVSSLALSPDGHYAMIFYYGGLGGRLWDAQTGQPVWASGRDNPPVRYVVFSPDSKTVLTGSRGGTVQLLDLTTGSEVRRFVGHSGAITSVAFSPDGTLIAAGGDDNQVLLWDVQSGTLIHTFSGHTGAVLSVAFSPDGKSVLSGSSDKTARLWDIQPPQRSILLKGSDKVVLGMAISHDGKFVLTGSDDGTARLWNAATGQAVRTFAGSGGPINAVAISPDDKYIVIGSAQSTTAELWDAATGQRFRTFGGETTANVSAAAFSPDGRYVLIGSFDNMARLYDVSSASRLRSLVGHSGAVSGTAFSSDGKYVLTGSIDNCAKLWDATTGQVIRTFLDSQPINSVAYSPDGKYVLTGGNDHTAKLWDAATGQVIRTFAGHSASVYGVGFSPDGKYVLTASNDKTTRLWDAATGEPLHIFGSNAISVLTTVNARGQDVGFSSNGKYFVMYSDNNTPEIMNTDYQGAVAFACSRLTRDLTDTERATYGVVSTEPSCPKFDTAIPTVTLQAWTPLPPPASTLDPSATPTA